MDANRRNIFRTQYFARVQAMRQRHQADHWFVEYAKKNPLKVGSFFVTTFDLIVIFCYLVSIEYFPVFDLRAFASIILASAFTGFLLVSGLSLCLFSPACLVEVRCLDEKSKSSEKEFLHRIGRCFGVAFVAFESFCFVVLAQSIGHDSRVSPLFWLIGVIVVGVFMNALRWERISALWSASQATGTSGKGLVRRFTLHVKTFCGEIRKAYADRFTLACGMLFVCMMELTAVFIFFIVLRDSPLIDDDKPDFGGLFFVVSFGGMIIQVVGFYLVNAWKNPNTDGKHRISSVLAALFTPVIITLFAQNTSMLFALPASLTKIGNFRVKEMTLSDAGCHAVEAQGGAGCVKLSDGTNKICNVQVMSRIGSETYLLMSLPGPKSARTGPRTYKGMQKPEENSRNLYDIYVPSKEILGVKPDRMHKSFTVPRIRTRMLSEVSECPANAVHEVNENVVLKESDLFDFDKYKLTEQGEATLHAFAQRLRKAEATATVVEVLGHADQIGSTYHNLSLSQLRALTVMNYLHEELDGKVRALRIDGAGMGSSHTIKSDVDCPPSAKSVDRIACLAQNRRVEIKVTRTL